MVRNSASSASVDKSLHASFIVMKPVSIQNEYSHPLNRMVYPTMYPQLAITNQSAPFNLI